MPNFVLTDPPEVFISQQLDQMYNGQSTNYTFPLSGSKHCSDKVFWIGGLCPCSPKWASILRLHMNSDTRSWSANILPEIWNLTSGKTLAYWPFEKPCGLHPQRDINMRWLSRVMPCHLYVFHNCCLRTVLFWSGWFQIIVAGHKR